jgi:hypothetical protein
MDHRKDNTAVKMDDKCITHGSNKTLRKTTKGWFLEILWRDDTFLGTFEESAGL